MLMKNEKKIIHRNRKEKRGVDYTLYSDLTIELRTSFISRTYGLRIPNDLKKFIKLPSKKNESIKTKVDFISESSNSKIEMSKVAVEFSFREDAYTNRKGKKRITKSVYLKPIKSNNFTQLRKLISQNKNILCIIQTLTPTDYFLKAKDIREKISFSNIDVSNMTLIVSGGIQKTFFDIYRDEKNFLYISTTTNLYKNGKVTLSSELQNLIPNIFNFDLFVCQKDEEPPLIIPAILHYKKNNRPLFELNFPHHSNSVSIVTIVFSHPLLSLNLSVKDDYSIKCYLQQLGFNIKSFKSNYITGQHEDSTVEESMRTIVQQAFVNKKSKIYSEVQIITNSPNENVIGNKHTFDEVILDATDDSLIFVEYKTSFTNGKHREIDNAIAEMFHYRRKIGEKAIILMLINDDLFLKTKIITKSFGSKNDIILIGKEELNYIYQQPKLLLDRIREFKDVKEQKQVILNKSILENTPLYKSINRLPSESILLKYKQLLLRKIPQDFRVKSISFNHIGVDFEREVGVLLVTKGFAVASNILFHYYNRKMEIDHLCFKDEELTIVSCRKATSVRCFMSFKLDIKQKVCKLEYRKALLNADNALLYLKVTPEVYHKMKEFEGKWVEGVDIIFHITD